MRPNSGDLLGPSCEEDLFPFLRITTQEWQFFTYAQALGLPEASRSTLIGAALARDSAVDHWNSWMYKQRNRNWFSVFQQHTLEEDYRNEKRGIFLTAGASVLVIHRCESVLATVTKRERPGFAPDGSPMALGYDEEVLFHCVLAPPHDDTMKVLPVNVVPNVAIFNH